jgi:hypothetical protein
LTAVKEQPAHSCSGLKEEIVKKILGLALVALIGAQAHATPVIVPHDLVLQVHNAMSIQNLINWKIGDYQKIKLESMFGNGTGSKKVTKEDTAQNAVWLVTEIAIMGQNQKVEALISRADGKTLKVIVNGEEQSPGEGGESNIEIIEQYETEVTVPAGKFECMYVKAKITQNGQATELEAWVNPVQINIDGMLKMIVKQGFMPITLILEEFGNQAI